MNKKYKLNYLSADFYNKYNSADYPEIENKTNRPYMVMLIQIENNTFAILFRTNIKHNNCYKFKRTSRSTRSATGLDFSKAVVLNDDKYIGAIARIDDREYIELDKNYHIIVKRFTAFLKGYIKYVNGTLSEFQSKNYKYTTLKYFHNELLVRQKSLTDVIDSIENQIKHPLEKSTTIQGNTKRTKNIIKE